MTPLVQGTGSLLPPTYTDTMEQSYNEQHVPPEWSPIGIAAAPVERSLESAAPVYMDSSTSASGATAGGNPRAVA